MPNFKKSSGFKMSGYSYPGKSPMKGKRKNADQAAAKEGQAEAMAKMEEFGDMKMKSTDILGKGSFKVDAPSPTKFVGEAITEGLKGAVQEGTKSLGVKLLEKGADAIVGGSVSAGINAIGRRKKEKPKRKSADVKAFSGIQMGRK
jgi:hypothetical protein